MRVLVIGGAGYIGSHTTKVLHMAGYEPVVFDNLDRGHRGAVIDAPLVVGDTANQVQLVAVMKDHGIEAVMHFAAHSQAGESMARPDIYFRNNDAYGLNVLDAMRQAGVKTIVFSSTAAVYGEPKYTPIDENHQLKPINPYGESKLFFERVLHWYDQAYGIRYASLRYFNAAGADPDGQLGEDHRPETHLIPIVLQAALGKRDKVAIYGTDYDTPDGTCIRDYIHVTDLAEAHILALENVQKEDRSVIYNLGNGKGFSVKEVIEAAREVVGQTIPAEPAPRRPGDPAILIASSERIQAELGWRPKYADIHTIIETAWRWMKAHPDGYAE